MAQRKRPYRWLPLLASLSAAGFLALGALAGVAWIAAAIGSPSTDHVDKAAQEDDAFALWGRNEDGSPIQWDPCSAIALTVNAEGGPHGWMRALGRAIAHLEAAGAPRLVVVSTTDERPSAERAAVNERYGQGWSPVLVAWSTPEDDDLPWSSIDYGISIPLAVGTPGERTLVSGQVVFNSDRDLSVDGDDRSSTWEAIMLHELMHLVGLDHVDDEGEMMHRFIGSGPIELGPGDRAGLELISSGDCRATPDPTQLHPAS